MLSAEALYRRKRMLACKAWGFEPAEFDSECAMGRVTLLDVDDLVEMLCADPETMWVAEWLYSDEIKEIRRQAAEAEEDQRNYEEFLRLLAVAVPEDEKSAARLAELRREHLGVEAEAEA